MGVTITSETLAAIHSHVAAEHPSEVCGLLLGAPGVIREARPALNLSPTPGDSFDIDPAALFKAMREERAGGPQLIGFYHSHPSGNAAPSARDEAGAVDHGRLWLIVGRSETRAWLSAATGFVEQALRVA